MRRYWLDKEFIHKDHVEIAGEVFHHICDVCRQKIGDQFEVLGSKGKAFLVEIDQLKKKSATAKIISEREIPPLKQPHIHLAISLPRPAVFDSVLERAVELGVASVQPFYSEFSFFREPSEAIEKKLPRWQKIVMSATQQCGRSELMEIKSPLYLEKVLGNFNPADAAMGLFAYEGRCDLEIAKALKMHKVSAVRNIWLFVGSEGGFSKDEVDAFRANRLAPVTLGEQVLRVETACLALISIIKYEYDLMQ
ncbi:MAG: hypothetical protein A4S09_00725 [Proteobacteria bacterium SG_bin7]|nr:MAG: hypothetical protein A4S09_00725 [Proteobacteria bacterium SG_bin7]